MSVDLTQFHQVFFEESFEGLDAMEASLMALNVDDIDSETINSIFRAAHSIKGGSATFGFNTVAEFTHVLETLLEEVRSGKRGVSHDDVNLLLQSVDCLREQIGALQSQDTPDTQRSDELKTAFEKILQADVEVAAVKQATVKPAPVKQAAAKKAPVKKSSKSKTTTSRKSSAAKAKPTQQGWKIQFIPSVDILRTGNEPMRMFRELAEKGSLTVTPLLQNLPSFIAMNPESCYLGWQLTLLGAVEKAAIEETFEWVADEAEITIEPIFSDSGSVESGLTAISDADEVVEDAINETPNETLNKTISKTINKTTADSPPSVSASSQIPVGANAAISKTLTKTKPTTESSSIRVAIDKIDSLINMVGELVITQSMLGQLGDNFSADQLPRLREGLGQLEHNTRELQESVMRIRMLPISFAFSRFPRMVRDLSQRLQKQMDIVLIGESTELDKTVMERIGDPLVHLVRNAIDHGIETPDERTRLGKNPVGKITLNAYHQSGNVVIEIMDDGKGLDKNRILEKAVEKGLVNAAEAAVMTDAHIYDLIFHPGFSTAHTVSDVSGRGVGMDVVKRNIQALNGSVDIRSMPQKGTTITIRLPLTLAILDGQLVRVGTNIYIFPLVSIVESLQVQDSQVNQVAGGCEVFQLRDEYVPIVRLHEIFAVKPDSLLLKDSLLVVVEADGEKVGVVVDELAAQQQVVIKSLEQNYQRVEGVSGATILGDGRVSLILDIPGIVNLAGLNHKTRRALERHAKSQLINNQQSNSYASGDRAVGQNFH